MIYKDSSYPIEERINDLLSRMTIREKVGQLNQPDGRVDMEYVFKEQHPGSFPYHVGQQPVFYSQVRGQHGDTYADMSQYPLYAFGYGLSYTEFEYSDITIEHTVYTVNDTLKSEYTVTNIGQRDVIEISHAHISDLVTSVTLVDKELKAYSRDLIKAGESVRVNIEIPISDCSIVNALGERIVESGDFKLFIGSSSKKDDLKSIIFSVK